MFESQAAQARGQFVSGPSVVNQASGVAVVPGALMRHEAQIGVVEKRVTDLLERLELAGVLAPSGPGAVLGVAQQGSAPTPAVCSMALSIDRQTDAVARIEATLTEIANRLQL